MHNCRNALKVLLKLYSTFCHGFSLHRYHNHPIFGTISIQFSTCNVLMEKAMKKFLYCCTSTIISLKDGAQTLFLSWFLRVNSFSQNCMQNFDRILQHLWRHLVMQFCNLHTVGNQHSSKNLWKVHQNRPIKCDNISLRINALQSGVQVQAQVWHKNIKRFNLRLPCSRRMPLRLWLQPCLQNEQKIKRNISIYKSFPDTWLYLVVLRRWLLAC